MLAFHLNAGANTLVVDFSGATIRQSGKDGPYHVSDLSIWVAHDGQGGNNFGELVLS